MGCDKCGLSWLEMRQYLGKWLWKQYVIVLISQLSLSLCFYKYACNYLNIGIVLIRPGGETPCLQNKCQEFSFFCFMQYSVPIQGRKNHQHQKCYVLMWKYFTLNLRKYEKPTKISVEGFQLLPGPPPNRTRINTGK